MELIPSKNPSFTEHSLLVKILLIFIITLGIFIRILQYSGSISYWMDELFSVINIENMTMHALLTTQPEYNQVVAPGYYVIQKGLLNLIGQSSEILFRFYPVVCSVIGLLLLFRIAQRYLSGLYLVASMAMICTGLGPWFYGTSAKPYAVEMMYIAFITLSLLRIQESPLQNWQYVMIGLIGGFGTFSSLICTAFMAGAIPYLFWTASTGTKRSNLILLSSLWLAGALGTVLYTQLALEPSVKEAMSSNHSYGFPPASILEFPGWLLQSFYDTMYYFLAITLPLPFLNIITIAILLFALIGIYALIKKDLTRGILLSLFIVMNLSLAVLYILPLTSRYGPATFWVFLIFAMYGLEFMREKIPFVKGSLVFGLALLLAFPNVAIATAGLFGLPQDIDPTEKLLTEIQKDYQADQLLLVHPRAYLQMDYYAPQVGFHDYYIMYTETSPSLLEAKLDALDPKEAWFVVTNILDFPSELDVASCLQIFDKRAKPIKRIDLTETTFAVLYDFTDG